MNPFHYTRVLEAPVNRIAALGLPPHLKWSWSRNWSAKTPARTCESTGGCRQESR